MSTAALRPGAGDTEFGRARSTAQTADLGKRGIVMQPADLGITANAASRDLLAAKTIEDLVRCSGGLYQSPARFHQGSPRTMADASNGQDGEVPRSLANGEAGFSKGLGAGTGKHWQALASTGKHWQALARNEPDVMLVWKTTPKWRR